MNVKLEKINKYFGLVKAVNDFDLFIPEKEFITLVGPSGCGKTTILRIIAGLERPNSGLVYFDEKVVNDLAPGDRNIAMVFQNYALYPHMNVFKNLGYPLKVRGTSKSAIRERVIEVAGVLEIGELLNRRPRELSGGQRQRVALGRAMVRNPSIFLMDEPLSNLDAKLRVTMRSELKRFHMQLQTTTIYVTHDQLEAMTMSDKIAIINYGRLQQYGSPEEVYNYPANLFVAGFIGSPPMNFIEGFITRQKETIYLQIDSFKQKLPIHLQNLLEGREVGKKLILGVRPQDLKITEKSNFDSLIAEVFMVEPVGSEKLVDLRLGQHTPIIAQLKTDEKVKVDEHVGLDINLSKIHLFDPETEQVIGHRDMNST